MNHTDVTRLSNSILTRILCVASNYLYRHCNYSLDSRYVWKSTSTIILQLFIL